MARGCALIDSRLDTAKIGSDGRVEVHRARLLAVFGGTKNVSTRPGSKPEKLNASKCFPLCPRKRTSRDAVGMSASCPTNRHRLSPHSTILYESPRASVRRAVSD